MSTREKSSNHPESGAGANCAHPLVRGLPEALISKMKECRRTWGMGFPVISDVLLLPFWERVQVVAIRDFVERVERRAEEKIRKTGKLEGAHYAAMTQLRDELCSPSAKLTDAGRKNDELA